MSRFDNNRRFGHHGQQRKKGDKSVFGLIIVLVGLFILFRRLDVFNFHFHDVWPFVLIAIGLIIGFKNRFQKNAWWILILIGGAHAIPEFPIMNTTSSALLVPAALILGGLLLIFRNKKGKNCETDMQVVTTTESSLNVDVTFGGRKEIVTSKDFRGGDVSVTFAGAEINMLQADSPTQPMLLNVKVSFGALELVVPSNWDLKNEIDPTFGGVEDHRLVRTSNTGPGNPNEERRTLILRGSCSFGNIEIKSY